MGLASGLRAASGELCVVVACDLPFLNAALIERLVELAEGWDLVAPIVAGQPEPTHAVYRRATCLPAIDRALARGERRMISFWPEVRVRAVPEEELRALDPDLRSFFNVNTPADLELAERWAAEGDRPAGADERGA
jgi:molybdopterin-guanine dinucleotide biosynthesis protein A